ncbi:leucine carboxyl methyltransferase domain-containing protein [Ditylenchus destructor]|uniref:Leucine carboxyl methyltransferase 1 n=1 Tax=Ditylenchus destructor TaxID=166010 RepID=A0AAD4N641_9BILA|nr:leucine carboxyl methyltransferase domain-containing protein [Ditylenchus destructor]
MESEADLGSGHLGTSISIRRRSASVSDDYSVQKTNDDATESKFAAIQLGYWQDKFISNFVYACTDNIHRRDPEISRGYWARTASIFSLVSQFVQKAGPSAQIVNIGCGFDTLYWRLKDSGQKFYKYAELDFSSVTSKKIRQIRRSNKHADLTSSFSRPLVENHHSDLIAGDYCLLGADLRQVREFDEKLKLADLDFSQPTLFIAECVLVYMDELQCDELLKEITGKFETVSFINYEQVNMTDNFSKIMLDNLNHRGIILPGLPACESLQSQKRRFLNTGWHSVHSWTVNEIYQAYLNPVEVERIEKLEPLDEKELLVQLLEHYCLVYASKDATKQRRDLADLVVA